MTGEKSGKPHLSTLASIASRSIFGIEYRQSKVMRCFDHGKSKIWTFAPSMQRNVSFRRAAAGCVSKQQEKSMKVSFSMAVYLAASVSTPSSGQYVFRIGMRDTPVWASATGYGASTQGSWGSIALTPPRNTRNAIGTDGSTFTAENIHYEMGSTRPVGMRQIAGSEGAVYFGIYNTKLLSIAGASNATTGGYLELTLLD